MGLGRGRPGSAVTSPGTTPSQFIAMLVATAQEYGLVNRPGMESI